MAKSDALSKIRVIRNSINLLINSEDLVVGDLIILSEGEMIPSDCLLIPNTTSTSTMHYTSALAKVLLQGNSLINEKSANSSCELKALVLAVGPETTLTSQADDTVEMQVSEAKTELQQKLNRIAESIGRIGLYVAILTFMVTVIFIILRTYQQLDRSFDVEFLQDVCHGLILALTIVFVATP